MQSLAARLNGRGSAKTFTRHALRQYQLEILHGMRNTLKQPDSELQKMIKDK